MTDGATNESASALPTSAVAEAAIRRSMLRHDGEYLYWLEQRPQEQGRGVIVRWSETSGCQEMTPTALSVRSRVHEYGGGEFAVRRGAVVFSADPEQQVWLRDVNGHVAAITAVSQPRQAVRYADFCWHPDADVIYAVRERHHDDSVSNELVALSLDGRCEVLASGADFYAAPRIAPDGSRLLWLQWSNPNMPWDGTELWQAIVLSPMQITDAEPLAGGANESVLQPGFAADNRLFALTDQRGYWQLAEWRADGWQFLHHEPTDCCLAPWTLGGQSWQIDADGQCWWLAHKQGFQQLWRQRSGEHAPQLVGVPDNCLSGQLVVAQRHVFLLGARVDRGERLFAQDTDSDSVIDICPPAAWPSAVPITPARLEWAAAENRQIPFYFYLPESSEPRLPLVMFCHSGPTGSASPALQPAIQFWTSRGYAVADVNYRGSDGYGRAWRQSLLGHWGDYDAEDCQAVLDALALHPAINARRIYLRGNSAGALTVLEIWRRTRKVRGLALRYPATDLPALVATSHKFESGYIKKLLGVSDASQLTHCGDSANRPAALTGAQVLIQHGSIDPVVPLEQSKQLLGRLAEQGVHADLQVYPGEGHGFRSGTTLIAALHSELAFFERHQ